MQLLGEGPPFSVAVGRTVQAEATALSLEDSMRERGRRLAKGSLESILYVKVRTVDNSWSSRELNEAAKQGTEQIYISRKETSLAAGRRMAG